MDTLLATPEKILQNLPLLWSFLLLVVRFGAMLFLLPGVGLGDRGMLVRVPACMAFAAASLFASPLATLPTHWIGILGSMVTEVFFGGALGLIPLLLIAGMQTAASLASTTMGLSGSSLFDPTTQTTVPELGRLYGDFTVILFLVFGGHYMAIYAASGFGETFAPGSFYAGTNTVALLMQNSADIFKIGCMVSAPVVVALLLTQFVMGIISKSVPTVNIFIISFPLTIGIGLIISALVLPEIVVVMRKEMRNIENSIVAIVEDRSEPDVVPQTLSDKFKKMKRAEIL